MNLEFLSQLIFEDCLIIYIVILFISVILSFVIMKLQTACLPLTNGLIEQFEKNRNDHPSRIENSIYPFREKIKKFKFNCLPSLGEVNRILYENEFKILMSNFPTPTLADVEYFKRRIHFQIIDMGNNILENHHSNRIDMTSLESQLGVNENSYKFIKRKLRYFEFSSLLHSFYMAILFELFDNFKNLNGPFDPNHSNDKEDFDFLNRIRNILRTVSTIDGISLCQLKELEILLYKISVDWLEENDELKLKNLKKIELEIFEYQNTVKISQNKNEIENNRVEYNSASGESDNLSDKISQNKNGTEDNGMEYNSGESDNLSNSEEQKSKRSRDNEMTSHLLKTDKLDEKSSSIEESPKLKLLISESNEFESLHSESIRRKVIEKIKIVTKGLSKCLNLNIEILTIEIRNSGIESETYLFTVNEPIKSIYLLILKDLAYPSKKLN